jgi:hypothetical protein
MVPHLRYDPAHAGGYFPGPDWWPRAGAHVLRHGELTSGISNPPLIALAAEAVGRRAPDPETGRGFWRRVFADLRDYVAWFRDFRTLPGSPLPVMVHPWESGWDNSPRWDFVAYAGVRPARAYQRLDTVHVDAAQRPTGKDYDTFLGLAELLDACDYDLAAYVQRSPFAVHDVFLDALWHAAAGAVNAIAAEVGEAAPFAARELEAYRSAFEAAHWDAAAEAYLDVDIQSGRRIAVPTAAGVAALAGGAASRERAVAAHTAYGRLCRGLLAVPTAAPGPAFEPERYWRGPIWLNVNWLVALGLDRYSVPEAAAGLRSATLELAGRGDLNEYFDPRTGHPLGATRFSWSAALALDLLQRKGKPA